MKGQGILNAQLIREIAAVGHTQTITIGDAGLPIPQGTKVIDLAVVKGVPSFVDVLQAVCSELVVESYVYAVEADTANPEIVKAMRCIMQDMPFQAVPHETLKEMSRQSNVIIRTGECTSYANVVLVAGVNF